MGIRYFDAEGRIMLSELSVVAVIQGFLNLVVESAAGTDFDLCRQYQILKAIT